MANRPYLQTAAELQRTQINVVKSKGILKVPFGSRHTITNHGSQLRSRCWFNGGRKTGEPGEKPSKHGGDQLQQLYSHAWVPSFLRIDTRLYPGGHPSSYNSARPGLTSELSGEKQRANRIRRLCSLFGSVANQSACCCSFTSSYSIICFYLVPWSSVENIHVNLHRSRRRLGSAEWSSCIWKWEKIGLHCNAYKTTNLWLSVKTQAHVTWAAVRRSEPSTGPRKLTSRSISGISSSPELSRRIFFCFSSEIICLDRPWILNAF